MVYDPDGPDCLNCMAGSHQAQIGKAIGEMLGGFFLTASGVTGEVLGTGLTTTEIGSVVGVPAMAVSAALVTSGAGNMAAGLRGLAGALLSSGSGGTGIGVNRILAAISSAAQTFRGVYRAAHRR